MQTVALKPRVLSCPVSLMEEIVLNAELKSTNSILTEVLLPLRYLKTESRAVNMASSVDLLVLNANW